MISCMRLRLSADFLPIVISVVWWLCVVRQEQEDDVFEKALAKFEKEQHIVEQLLAGKTTLEIYGFDKLIERLENL